MSDDTPNPLNNVITIDDERIESHLERVVRGTVETLNALLDAEAEIGCAMRNAMSAASRVAIHAPATTSAACRPRLARSAEGSEAAPASV
jgi:hypothetical protein